MEETPIAPFIFWQDVPKVGIPIIDSDHKKLVEIINQLYYSIIVEKLNKPALLNILLELFDYTVHHFKTEENIMQNYDMPGREEHKIYHDNLQNQVLDFASIFFEYDVDVRKDLLDFLKQWLVVHIEKSDRLIADFIHKNGYSVEMSNDCRPDFSIKKKMTLQDAFLEIRRAHQEINRLKDRLDRLENLVLER